MFFPSPAPSGTHGRGPTMQHSGAAAGRLPAGRRAGRPRRTRTEDGMAKRSRTPTPEPSPSVTRDRAARLCRLLRLLGTGSQTRANLLRRLDLDVRGFYRDLETLRKFDITVEL